LQRTTDDQRADGAENPVNGPRGAEDAKGTRGSDQRLFKQRGEEALSFGRRADVLVVKFKRSEHFGRSADEPARANVGVVG
jgi:hypothetical protein